MLDYSVAMLGNPNNAEEPKKAYAYLQSRSQFGIDEIADHMVSHGCNYDRADIVAIIMKLVSCTRELLSDGYRIQLGDLGSFHLTCNSEGAESLRAFSRSNIKSINVRFKPSGRFTLELGNISLHKVPTRAFAAAALELQLSGKTVEDLGLEPEEDNTDPGTSPQP